MINTLKVLLTNGYFYLFNTIILTVASQLIIKWRITGKFVFMPLPETILGKFIYLINLIFDPFIFMALCFTFLSGLSWMATMSKLAISYAYPFTMLGFVAVMLLSALLLNETMNGYKIIGSVIIILGVIIASRGM